MDNLALFYDGFDASFFDDEDDVFGFEERGLTPTSATSTDPATLAFALLLLSTYTAPPPWTGAASAGTSASHSFIGANGAVTGATMAERTWQRVSTTGLTGPSFPWAGRASTGISASESWDNLGGLNPPSQGLGINGYDTPYFDGSSGQNLQASSTIDQYVSASASSGWMLVKPISILNDSGNPQANDPLLEDSGQYYGITLSSTARIGTPAATFWIVTGGNVIGVDVPVNLVDWNLLEWRHTGTTLEMRNSTPNSAGVWQVVSNDGLGHNVGSIDIGYVGGTLYMGQSAFGTINADFELADIAIQNTAMTYAQLDSVVVDVELYFNKFYAIYPGPTTGASLNGHTSANFDGFFNVGKYAGALSDLIGPCDRSFYIGSMFKARTVPADTPTARYVNAIIFGDLNQNIYVSISAAGISAGMYDQNAGGWVDTGALACSTGAWHFVQIWHDGQSLFIQLDNGTPISVQVGLDWFVTNVGSMSPCIGGNGASSYLDGEVHLVEAMQGQPNALQRVGMGMYLQTRYGVSMGFPSSSTAYSRSIGESITLLTDNLVRRFIGSRSSISEAIVKVSEAVSRFSTGGRAVSENIVKATDSSARAFAGFRSITESDTAPSDVAARLFSGHRSLSESTPAPTDAAARSMLLFRSVPETITIPIDAVTRVRGATRSVSEPITAPTDTASRVFIGSRSIAESIIKVTDTTARTFIGFRNIAESVAIPTDQVVRSVGLGRSVSESAVIPLDSLARSFVGFRSISESIPAGIDSVARTFAAVHTISETISAPTDSLARLFIGFRPISESITIPTDAVSGSKNGGAGSRNISETILVPSDGVARSFIGLRSLSESIAIPTDGKARLVVCFRSIAESVAAPTDTPSRNQAPARAISESVIKVTDSPSRVAAAARSITENKALSDSLARAVVCMRSVAEAVTAPIDGITRRVIVSRSITDSLTAVIDSVVRDVTKSNHFIFEAITAPTDNIGFMRRLNAHRSVAEALARPTDVVLRFRTYANSAAIVPIQISGTIAQLIPSATIQGIVPSGFIIPIVVEGELT